MKTKFFNWLKKLSTFTMEKNHSNKVKKQKLYLEPLLAHD